ncbi:MAG: DUF6320 domain-containing protein [Acetivibrio sp.]
MKKCNRCNVLVKGSLTLCPLCGEILLKDPEESSDVMKPMYPKIALNPNTFHFVKRMVSFLALITAISLFIINYATYEFAPILWSLISVAAIGYGMITINYSILNNSNLAAKLLVQTIGASILCVIIDVVMGYKGWSVNFIIPSFLLFSDLAMIILMIVNPMKRRSYFMYQIAITIFAVLSFALCFTPLITRKEFALIAGLVCFITLLGSIFFGDKGFQNELIRRFHI